MRADYTVDQDYESYDSAQQDRWRRLYRRQIELVPGRACPEYESGKVPRIFPVIPSGWKASAKILVLDESIPNEVLEQHLIDAGVFVGIGRWRAENRGLYGRFRVVSKKWS